MSLHRCECRASSLEADYPIRVTVVTEGRTGKYSFIKCGANNTCAIDKGCATVNTGELYRYLPLFSPMSFAPVVRHPRY